MRFRTEDNVYRSYDPVLGRYISADPIGQSGGVNLFAFANSDPVGEIDPFGLYGSPLDSLVMAIALSGTGPAYAEASAAGTKYVAAAVGGASDFVDNYQSMKEANTIGADRYFHCMANCEATKRGQGGRDMSSVISEGREQFDELIKRDPPQECAADRLANDEGRGATPGESCPSRCAGLRPSTLDPRF